MANAKGLSAGSSYFSSNSKGINAIDWSNTSLGERSKWPPTLTAHVNFVCTLPHAAAVLWGSSLHVVHNLAWAAAMHGEDVQGKPAEDCFPSRGLGSLQSTMKGQTVKVASEYLLDKTPKYQPESPILLSPLFDEHGACHGVLGQLLHMPDIDKPLDDLLQDYEQDPNLSRSDEKADSEDKASIRVDEPREVHGHQRSVNLKENRLFRRFAQILPTGLAVLDERAEALFVNDDFYRLTTHASSKAFKAWPQSIYKDDFQTVMSEYQKAIETNSELRIEFRCADVADNPDIPWRLFIMRPLDDMSRRTGFICALVDITRMKAAENAQRDAAHEAQARRKQQESFIDMVSHEIRNPLSAILHSAEAIIDSCRNLMSKARLKDDEDIETISESAETILLCASHQNSLVDDILSFSKLDASMLTLSPKPIDPSPGFGQSFRLFQAEMKSKNIAFDYALDTTYRQCAVQYVMADLKRLTQVLVNLLSNAMKFTAKKVGERKISVVLAASIERPNSYPPNLVFFDSSSEKERNMDSTNGPAWGTGETVHLMVSVKDTGIGMSDASQKELFRKFRQATPRTQEQYGGSGLGLFISKKLCQLHGGEIGVASQHGKGSTFGFFFKAKRTDKPKDGSDGIDIIKKADLSLPNEADSRVSDLSFHHGRTVKNSESSIAEPRTEDRSDVQLWTMDERYDQTAKFAQGLPHQDRTDLATATSNKGPADTPDTTALKVLLVEDNVINAKVLARQLKIRGFEVMTAHNGQEAIDMSKRISSDKASWEKPEREVHGPAYMDVFDIILMDHEMPIKNGDVATREIREFNENIPILGVSANAREEQMQGMRDAGMNAVISKPFKVDDLVKRIRGLLDSVNPPE